MAIPSLKVEDGKSILLKAAIEPLIPTIKIPTTAITRKNKTLRGAFSRLNERPPLANHAVKAIIAINVAEASPQKSRFIVTFFFRG